MRSHEPFLKGSGRSSFDHLYEKGANCLFAYPTNRCVGENIVHDGGYLGFEFVDELGGVVFAMLYIAEFLFPLAGEFG